ncbi:reverse transcriptase domain-containing protein [Tanacetum coccineum]
MNQEKQKEKDEVQIHKFWQMFKQLHINITLADALILIPKYQKTLKSLLSNKEKLIELANTPVSENCSTVILKKLPEKLGDPGKFLIPGGFNELKCKALADLGASINLMQLSVWKELGLPKLIPTQMTLELANRDICSPKGIARDVFVPVGKFTFPMIFTACALIDVHGEEMILHDGLATIFSRSSPMNSLHITFHWNDDLPFDSESDLLELEYLLNNDPIKDMDSILEDSVDENSLDDNLDDTISEEFADELAPSESFPPGVSEVPITSLCGVSKAWSLNRQSLGCATPLREDTDNVLVWGILEMDIRQKDKNEAKTDKIEHEMEKREKTKLNRSQSEQKSKSTPTKSTVKTGADTKEYLMEPPVPI